MKGSHVRTLKTGQVEGGGFALVVNGKIVGSILEKLVVGVVVVEA